MKLILLTRGKATLVDDVDFERFGGLNWCYCKGYAMRKEALPNGKRKTQYLHRLILGEPDKDIDHRNLDTLDNRRENLRPATKQQNNCNVRKRKNNTSGRKGVYWYKRARKWRAEIVADGKFVYLGLFEDINEASEVYRKASSVHHGEFARAA